MRISMTKSKITVNLIGFIIILFSLGDIVQSQSIVLIGSIISVIAFSFSFPITDKYFMPSIILICVLMITSLLNPLFTDNGIGGSFILLGNLLLSFIYFQTGDKKKLTIWIIASYFLTVFFIVYNLFVLKLPANDIYEGLSRNHAGFVLTFWSVFVLFHLSIAYSKVLITIPIISLFISVFLIGRTSIAVNFILLIHVFYFKFKDKGVIPFIIAFFLFSMLLYFVLHQYGTLLFMETNISGGLETPRWRLWDEYINDINLKSFIFGVDVTKNQYIHLYGDNPHNSFLKFHSRVGLGSIVYLVLYLLSFLNYLKSKNFYILGLLLLISFRAFFDSDILIGKFDFIFFIITFYWTQLYKNKKYEYTNFNNNSFIQQ